MARRFARPLGGVGYASATSGTITGGASDTKGNWADLIAGASILRDVSEVVLVTATGLATTNADTSCLLDIGLGNTGNAVDKIVVSDVPIGGWPSFAEIRLPLHVPAGTRIAARIAGVIAAETITFLAIANYGPTLPGGFGGFHVGTALGINATASGPAAGDLTDNAWEEVIASTAVDYRAVQGIICQPPGDNNTQQTSNTIDIGVGAAAAEQVIGTVYGSGSAAELFFALNMTVYVGSIPAGSRLAMRKNTTNDMSGTIIGWR